MNPYTQVICGHDGDAFEINNVATSTARNPAEWFSDWVTGGRSDAGVAVNGYTALTHCPLWQGVNIIAGDIGQTPVRLVRKKFTEQRKHAAWNLLRVRPNELQSPSVFKETLIQWALIWGNGVAWIRRRGSTPVDLVPLRPDCIEPELINFDSSQVMLYHYTSPVEGKRYTFFPNEVIHIQGLTSDGVWGYPLHQIARNTIGHGLALQKHGNKSFANGAMPAGVLEHPAKLPAEARDNLRNEWQKIHGGSENQGKIAILWEGMKFNATSMTNIDAQWIDAKRLDVYEAAGLLVLPPHKLGAMQDSSVRANLEEQNSDYVQRSLRRWYNRCSEEFSRKLLTEKEWLSDEFAFMWDIDEFLKADIDTLTTVHDRLVKATIECPNEARDKIGLPPYEGGDVFGSPAINPRPQPGKEPAEDEKPPKTPEKQAENVQNAHRELLYDRILHLVEREGHNLNRAAKNAKNFVEWLDEFYLPSNLRGAEIDSQFCHLAKSIVGTSVRACLSAGFQVSGFDRAIANYAKHRHAVLLEACSDVTQAELPATVERVVNTEAELIAQGLLATSIGITHGT